MELFCYQAECGDAIRIRYIGDDGNPHNMFFDSGYERTYRNILRQEINTLIQIGENIDLWTVSHIHDDHIGGIMKYIKAVKAEEIEDIAKVWFYNSPWQYPFYSEKKSDNISSAMSIGQGDKLYNFLNQNNKLPKKDITTDLEAQDFFGMKIHILSPTPLIIRELRNKYQTGIPFEKNEISTISYATSAIRYDYHKKIEDFNEDDSNEDPSLENRSSISLLLEFQNKKILWLADSHPTVIIESLTKMKYSNDNPLMCDCVIVSHHASKNNNSSLLFDMIRCDKYIISSNGENKHCLPNKEVLAKIIRNKNRDLSMSYSLYFTYDTLNLKNIFESDSNDIFKKWYFNPIYSSKSYINIEL
jgi:beta-lactamase superfamily II metal-dependent hydrolase